tara:strand:- start:2075 stop:2356 length:282 start_codon:yes stop_codon:yes gene_type:complete
MIDIIKKFIVNGWGTLKGLLKLEWLNFKNWKKWTALRALYFLCVVDIVLGTIFGFYNEPLMWYWVIYFAVCCFFKVEPVLWLLDKLGFSKTEI